MLNNPVYRAIVTYSNASTGAITVRIPALSGASSTVDISKIGRTAYNGVWQVPAIGSQIVVTADDHNLTNVFWVQVAPPTNGDATLASIIASIEAINSQLASIQASKDVTIFEVLDIGS